MIKEYNKIIKKIVRAYVVRHFKELYNEELDEIGYNHYIDLMEYKWVLQWPINISEDWYDLSDIILAQHHQIPCKCLQDYLHRELDRYQKGTEEDCNLYNYWMTKWKKT